MQLLCFACIFCFFSLFSDFLHLLKSHLHYASSALFLPVPVSLFLSSCVSFYFSALPTAFQFVVLCFFVTAEDFSFSCFVQCLKLLVLYKQFTPGALKLLPECNQTVNVSNYFCQRGCVFGRVCVHVFHSVCKCGISKSSKLILVNFVEWGDVKTPLKFALHPPRSSRAA